MEELITGFATHGLIALFVLMWIDTMGLPLPSEIPLLYAGYLISQHKLDIGPAGVVSALGALGGSLLAYTVSRRYGRAAVLKWGRKILITEEHLHHSERWFARFGPTAVFMCRMIPLARTLISIPAGIAEMNPVRFATYTFFGSLPWAFGLMGLGWVLGENWDHVLGSFSLASMAAAAVLVAAAGVWYLRRRRASRASRSAR